jgi:hypothetical protein
MHPMHTARRSSGRLRVVFDDRVMTLDLARRTTFAEVAEKCVELSIRVRHKVVAVAVTWAVPTRSPRAGPQPFPRDSRTLAPPSRGSRLTLGGSPSQGNSHLPCSGVSATHAPGREQ